MMPQFDIFSFSSQLFWVFLCFSCLYFSLSFYLLPSISVILKIRKRKLSSAITSNANDNVSLTSSLNLPFVSFVSKDISTTQTGINYSFNKYVLQSNFSKLIPLNFYYKLPMLIML